jgi:hypothetical protein
VHPRVRVQLVEVAVIPVAVRLRTHRVRIVPVAVSVCVIAVRVAVPVGLRVDRVRIVRVFLVGPVPGVRSMPAVLLGGVRLRMSLVQVVRLGVVMVGGGPARHQED